MVLGLSILNAYNQDLQQLQAKDELTRSTLQIPLNVTPDLGTAFSLTGKDISVPRTGTGELLRPPSNVVVVQRAKDELTTKKSFMDYLGDLFVETPDERAARIQRDLENENVLEKLGLFKSDAERAFQDLDEERAKNALLSKQLKDAAAAAAAAAASGSQFSNESAAAAAAVNDVRDALEGDGFFEKYKGWVVGGGVALAALIGFSLVKR